MSITAQTKLKGVLYMDKLYGYKEKDVIGLAQYIKERGSQSLSQTFSDYARDSGKAKGTVRNLYYALAKQTNMDKELCEKYFEGKPLSVSKIVVFDGEDERELIKKVLIGKQNGKSVRSVIMELANGNGKLALRYQNKFRNALKSNRALFEQVAKEINVDVSSLLSPKKSKDISTTSEISNKIYNKLQDYIMDVVEKSVVKLVKENQFLREKNQRLERDNLKLNRLFCPSSDPKNILKMICEKHNGSMLN